MAVELDFGTRGDVFVAHHQIRRASILSIDLDDERPFAFEKLFPAMPKEMLDALFGKTFNPEGLDARTRFLVAVAAQTVLGPLGEPQLKPTIRNALAAGATKREVAEVIWQMSMFGGMPAMQKALELAQSVFAETTGDAA